MNELQSNDGNREAHVCLINVTLEKLNLWFSQHIYAYSQECK